MLPISRAELIGLLSDIDVDLPPRTKLPQDELEKRVRKALGHVQQITRILPDNTLQIAPLQRWPPDSEKALEDCFYRTNWEEIAEGFKYKLLTGSSDYEMGTGTALMDLKLLLVELASWWKDGNRLFLVQDKEKEESSIAIRVSDPCPQSFLCSDLIYLTPPFS